MLSSPSCSNVVRRRADVMPYIQAICDSAVKGLVREMSKAKNLTVRLTGMRVLRNMTIALDGGLGGHLESILPILIENLNVSLFPPLHSPRSSLSQVFVCACVFVCCVFVSDIEVSFPLLATAARRSAPLTPTSSWRPCPWRTRSFSTTATRTLRPSTAS